MTALVLRGRRYQLRSGHGAPGGQLAQVSTFDSEDEARQAFLAIRLSPGYQHGWAELVDAGATRGGRPAQLCWFAPRP
jgi:hypothetical protein